MQGDVKDTIINQAGHGISTETSLKDRLHANPRRQILKLRRNIPGNENSNLKDPVVRITL